MLCRSCTEDSAKIRGEDCNIPKDEPHLYLEIVNMFCRLVSRVLISWWDYVFTRPKSLGVKGQEPDFVYVIMQIINKI
jgi:hypothetical protein